MFLIHLFSSAESSLATECLFARFRRERCFICIYIYRDVYIYICSFMCKFRQSVLSTAETTFCLCVAFLFCCTFVMDVHGFWVWENNLQLSALMKLYFSSPKKEAESSF